MISCSLVCLYICLYVEMKKNYNYLQNMLLCQCVLDINELLCLISWLILVGN
jgi:hypothetical protein